MAKKCLLHKSGIEEDAGYMYLIVELSEGARKYYVCEPCVLANPGMTYTRLEKLAKRNPGFGERYEKFNERRAREMVDDCTRELLALLNRRSLIAM